LVGRLMWFNVLGMGIKTAAKLYSDKQKTKEALSEARLLHAEKMRRGEIEYKGKVFEHQKGDWKDEFVLIVLSTPIFMLAYSVFADDPEINSVNDLVKKGKIKNLDEIARKIAKSGIVADSGIRKLSVFGKVRAKYRGAKATTFNYIKKPVTVLDYASLYPSSMISENLSHDSLVISDKYLGDSGIKELEKIGYGYVDVTHDVFKWKDPKIRSKGKVKIGTKTCRFVQPPNKEKSIIPKILMKLLKARKDTRAKIKTAC